MANVVATSDSQHPAVSLTGALSLGAAAILGLVGFLFWPTLSSLPHIWDVDPNYSHGFVVPVASAFFFWRVYKEQGLVVAPASSADITAGIIRIVAGLVGHVIAVFVGMSFVDVASMLLMLSGVWIATLGRESYKPYAFPLWFLIFTAPLPARLYQALAINLQQIASGFSEFIFHATDIPVYREGCYIQVHDFNMEVGAACSGVRQLMAIIALSLAIAHLSTGKTWFYKWTLSLAAIPVAVLANCIRVTLTGFILIWFGRKWAEGVYHELEGLAIVLIAAVLILLFAWWLAGLRISRVEEPEAKGNAAEGSSPAEKAAVPGSRTMIVLGVLAFAVAGQVWLNRHLAAAEAPPEVPLRHPLKSLPLQIGDWKSPGDQKIEERLQVGDEHLKRAYQNQKTGQVLSIWMVYSADGADREHHPEVCMAVAGQPEELRMRTTLAVPGHKEPVQQYRFGLTGKQQWVFYWYYTLPRPDAGELSDLQAFYRRMHNRPSSLTLEVFAPDRSSQAQAGARAFVKLLDAEIQRYVGKGAVRESRRMPVTIVDRPPPE